ncbi:aldo-keto reductase family 1 member C13-like protein [Cricetulus griseus]|uniref:Aldo-keto reductase family 1 member C13-like protein n=1 Tax=Cricetulus griseus TaxID=10029 RepID=A0A061IB13_CRIGR|nr:aldo-keto reductase family 1 member C13-like protein [Cricetulus griseus]
MSSKQQLVRLNDGHYIPALGFGTYKPNEVPRCKSVEAAKLAIGVGYRHIDTAYVYQIEEEIGQAIQSNIKAGDVKREDLFITTKSGDNDFPVDEQGKLLFDTVDFCATWEALEKCKDAGLVKSIGVSNFNHRQLERILNKPGLKYKPVCNQGFSHVLFEILYHFSEDAFKDFLAFLMGMGLRFSSGRCKQIQYSDVGPLLVDGGVTVTWTSAVFGHAGRLCQMTLSSDERELETGRQMEAGLPLVVWCSDPAAEFSPASRSLVSDDSEFQNESKMKLCGTFSFLKF